MTIQKMHIWTVIGKRNWLRKVFKRFFFWHWIRKKFFENFGNLESHWQIHCHVVFKLKSFRWLWMKQNVLLPKLFELWTWNGFYQHISTWLLLLLSMLSENFNANNTFRLHQQYLFDFQKKEIFQMSGKSLKHGPNNGKMQNKFPDNDNFSIFHWFPHFMLVLMV